MHTHTRARTHTLASPAMEHWDTCPFDFQLFIFRSLQSRTNSDIRLLHVVAYPVKITLLVSCPLAPNPGDAIAHTPTHPQRSRRTSAFWCRYSPRFSLVCLEIGCKTSTVNKLERFVPEMTYFVSRGTSNSAHTHTVPRFRFSFSYRNNSGVSCMVVAICRDDTAECRSVTSRRASRDASSRSLGRHKVLQLMLGPNASVFVTSC